MGTLDSFSSPVITVTLLWGTEKGGGSLLPPSRGTPTEQRAIVREDGREGGIIMKYENGLSRRRGTIKPSCLRENVTKILIFLPLLVLRFTEYKGRIKNSRLGKGNSTSSSSSFFVGILPTVWEGKGGRGEKEISQSIPLFFSFLPLVICYPLLPLLLLQTLLLPPQVQCAVGRVFLYPRSDAPSLGDLNGRSV